MDKAEKVDEDIRRLIDRAIDPEFVGRLVADPEGVIRANGWSIAPDRVVAALRSAGAAPADVEVLRSRISYSGLGRLASAAIGLGLDAQLGTKGGGSSDDPPGTAAPDGADAGGQPEPTVPFAMDDGMKGVKAAPVDGVPDESGT